MGFLRDPGTSVAFTQRKILQVHDARARARVSRVQLREWLFEPGTRGLPVVTEGGVWIRPGERLAPMVPPRTALTLRIGPDAKEWDEISVRQTMPSLR
jgi:hypothetical protein